MDLVRGHVDSPQIIITVVYHVVYVEIKILDYVCNERLRVEIWSRPNSGSGKRF